MGKQYILRFDESAPSYVPAIVLVTYAKQGIKTLKFRSSQDAKDFCKREKRRIERAWMAHKKTEPCFADGFSRQGDKFTRKEAPTQKSVGMQIKRSPYHDAGGPNDTRAKRFRKH